MEEIKAQGARGELQQVLTTPPRTVRQVSLHVLSSSLEVAMEVHVEEADPEAL